MFTTLPLRSLESWQFLGLGVKHVLAPSDKLRAKNAPEMSTSWQVYLACVVWRHCSVWHCCTADWPCLLRLFHCWRVFWFRKLQQSFYFRLRNSFSCRILVAYFQVYTFLCLRKLFWSLFVPKDRQLSGRRWSELLAQPVVYGLGVANALVRSVVNLLSPGSGIRLWITHTSYFYISGLLPFFSSQAIHTVYLPCLRIE